MKTKINKTTNYEQFRFLDGNRPVNQRHVMNLRKSIEERYVPTPIMVDSEFRILDGQHRFMVLRELNLPLYYIIQDDKVELGDVRELNKNAKNWDFSDYLYSYMEVEKRKYPKDYHLKPYHIFDWFKRSFELPNYVTLEVLYGSYSRVGTDVFKDGTLEIIDLQHSKEVAQYLRKMKPYHDGWNKRTFLFAMLRIMFQKNFNKTKWLRKLKLNSAKLVHCTNINDYIDTIERIYNWNEAEKVMFVRERAKS